MSECDHFIIANSSFSWWGAWLSRKDKKIIRPVRHFAGPLLERCDIKDYYPPEWTPFDGEKIDLNDCTFTIPVHRDHSDREQNLSLVIAYLQKHFNTNIIIGEHGSSVFDRYGCRYVRFDFPEFHRTAMLNSMAEMADTPIIANWDADVLASPLQILETVQRIREGADVCYPYSGRFIRLERNKWLPYLKSLDIGVTAGTEFEPVRRGDAQSTGGAVFFNRDSFFRGGGENENFIAFGPEDACRYERFTNLGFDVQRTPGPLFHIEHFCGPNSGTNNRHIKRNRQEWEKVAGMSKEELEAYIQTWPWVAQLTEA